MGLLFELAVLLLLAFVAVELYLLRADLARLPLILGRAEEKKDSPTINVNVGTMSPAPAPEEPKPVEAPELPPEAEIAVEAAVVAEEPAEEAPPPIPEPHRGTIIVNQTPSGIVALKCPSCQAENSSYRSECFNCGAPLH
jgi:hypothetical protein